MIKRITLVFICMVLMVCNTFAQEYTGKSKRIGNQPKPISQEAIAQPEIKSDRPERFAPFIKADVVFHDSSGNNMIDADESAEVKLTVYNIGQTTAKNCILNFEPTDNDKTLKIAYNEKLGDIKYKDTVVAVVHLKASHLIRTRLSQFIIKITETDGFNLDPEKIFSVNTREYQPPILRLAGYGISDENRNNMIEKAEKFSITLRLQNIGESTAENVKVKIIPGDNVIPINPNREREAESIKYGEYTDVVDTLVTNTLATEARLKLHISESMGMYGIDTTLILPFNKIQHGAESIIIAKVENIKKPIQEVNSLTNDIIDDIPKAGKEKKDAIAIIIGNKDYRRPTPNVNFAFNDAILVHRYVASALGYSEANILDYQDATQADFNAVFGTENNFKGKLYDYVKRGTSEVFIYYSGHGAPDVDKKKGYLVPVDCDPNNVKLNGYALATLYKNLDQLAKEKEVPHLTIVFDACFTGASPNGNLLANISPIGITIENDGLSFEKSTILCSSAADQVSNWYPDMQQGLFTYFFLKGLKGAADKNHDGVITVEELFKYIADENDGVPYWSLRKFGRKQTPTYSGSDFEIFTK